VLEEAERREAPADIARTHHHLGISAQHRAEYAIAERHFRAALRLNQRLGRTAAEASNRSHLGTLARLTGSPLTGLAEGRRALALFNGTDDIRGSGDAHLTFGDCLRDLGRVDEAQVAYRAAVAAHEAMGDVLAAEEARGALAALPAAPPGSSSTEGGGGSTFDPMRPGGCRTRGAR
jgi:tetratricopeptide (TPR) repeat protein